MIFVHGCFWHLRDDLKKLQIGNFE
ncbi:MAG TPA: hypothetical protein DER40_13630 [Geobacter sp.]|nr:hypothetical protein [Geobacter sp.]HCE68506.1 hypothetical protein [Geobacter sp.]